MTTAGIEEQRARALDLHMAGLPSKKIAEHLQVTDARARKLVKDALSERVGGSELTEEVRAEIARMDAMLFGLWPQARRGNFEAVDRVLAISERRERLVNPKANKHELRNAFDAAIQSSDQIKDVDCALIEAGRKIADRIDAATAEERGENLTKALYLMPHMMNVLKEALATPAARAAVKKPGDDADAGGNKLGRLRAVTGQQQRRSSNAG